VISREEAVRNADSINGHPRALQAGIQNPPAAWTNSGRAGLSLDETSRRSWG